MFLFKKCNYSVDWASFYDFSIIFKEKKIWFYDFRLMLTCIFYAFLSQTKRHTTSVIQSILIHRSRLTSDACGRVIYSLHLMHACLSYSFIQYNVFSILYMCDCMSTKTGTTKQDENRDSEWKSIAYYWCRTYLV